MGRKESSSEGRNTRSCDDLLSWMPRNPSPRSTAAHLGRADGSFDPSSAFHPRFLRLLSLPSMLCKRMPRGNLPLLLASAHVTDLASLLGVPTTRTYIVSSSPCCSSPGMRGGSTVAGGWYGRRTGGHPIGWKGGVLIHPLALPATGRRETRDPTPTFDPCQLER